MTREAFLEAFEKWGNERAKRSGDLPDSQEIADWSWTLLQSEQSGLREALVHARCLLTDSQWELVLHHIGMQAYIDKRNPSEAIALVKAAIQVSTPPSSLGIEAQYGQVEPLLLQAFEEDAEARNSAEANGVPPPASSPGAESEKAIIDLMDALKASIASAKARDAQKRKSHRYRK